MILTITTKLVVIADEFQITASVPFSSLLELGLGCWCAFLDSNNENA